MHKNDDSLAYLPVNNGCNGLFRKEFDIYCLNINNAIKSFEIDLYLINSALAIMN